MIRIIKERYKVHTLTLFKYLNYHTDNNNNGPKCNSFVWNTSTIVVIITWVVITCIWGKTWKSTITCITRITSITCFTWITSITWITRITCITGITRIIYCCIRSRSSRRYRSTRSYAVRVITWKITWTCWNNYRWSWCWYWWTRSFRFCRWYFNSRWSSCSTWIWTIITNWWCSGITWSFRWRCTSSYTTTWSSCYCWSVRWVRCYRRCWCYW